MKKLALLIVFLLLFLFSHSQVKKIYNIYEYEMQLNAGENSTVYYNNQRCYSDWIEYSHDKDYFYLKSQSFDIKFHIITIKENKKNREDWKMMRYFVVYMGNSHPYYIVEMEKNSKIYLTITPIRFNSQCSIDEAGMIISSEKICSLP